MPEILAPAGDQECFLAALAAGADAIYLGLKRFSARMEADNFSLPQVGRLLGLAHENGRKVYVAMNSIIKPGEERQVADMIGALAHMGADGLIAQDLGLPRLAREAGFQGQIALSTLANVCDARGLLAAKDIGVQRVIIPRELSVDEMRIMGDGCPPGLGLECFVHGALCYCVSGRCYWSSYMGGKSGLRGRCVQPCRRVYNRLREKAGKRHFACQDLELGALTRLLLDVPNLVSWKIEGRKKGPHYVYHAVTAYRMLRDNAGDSKARKMALEILEFALGRPGGKARFLAQKKQQPMTPQGHTSSGKLAGVVRTAPGQKPVVRAHFELKARDLLRIGVEDERWHATLPVKRSVPKAGALPLDIPKHKTPPNGTPVFLVDRRDPELDQILKTWRKALDAIPQVEPEIRQVAIAWPRTALPKKLPDMVVERDFRPGARGRVTPCLWLTPRTSLSRTIAPRTGIWLPPAIWPEDEEKYERVICRLWRDGARLFVCNAPWQRAYFPENLPGDAFLVAGPFCNLANALAIEQAAEMGFRAAFASPELERESLTRLARHSPLPLGLVLAGNWPAGVSRFGLLGLNPDEQFSSPKGEGFWARNYGGLTWIFPAWELNLEEKRDELEEAGFSFFARLLEKAPHLEKRARPGLFNWAGELL